MKLIQALWLLGLTTIATPEIQAAQKMHGDDLWANIYSYNDTTIKKETQSFYRIDPKDLKKISQQEDSLEYLNDTIVFQKHLVKERTDAVPYPWLVDPIIDSLEQKNLRKEERDAYQEMRRLRLERDSVFLEKYKAYNRLEKLTLPRKREVLWKESLWAGETVHITDSAKIKIYLNMKAELDSLEALSDDLKITTLDLMIYREQTRKIFAIINPDNEWFEHNEFEIRNPQQLVIVNEEDGLIYRFPVSLWKYGANNRTKWATPPGLYGIQTHFDVADTFRDNGISEAPSSPLNATHGRHKWVYKLEKDRYEQRGAAMVKDIITIGADVGWEIRDNVSWMRGIFIHGTNSLRTWKNGDKVVGRFGDYASNGCIRMHPDHLDLVIENLRFGIPYYQDKNGQKRWIKKDISNKISFKDMQVREDPDHFISPGTMLMILEGK
jgi:hypothetical protein